MGYTIQIKRATAARWVELNPVLEEGEPGVELDTSRMKIGDGFTPWVDLSYSSGGSSTPIGSISASDVFISDVSGNFVSNDIEGAMAELFTNVDDGKGLIATAIIDKGGNASSSDTFSTLANKIRSLPTGTSDSSSYPIFSKTVVAAYKLNIPIASYDTPQFVFSDSIMITTL